MDSKESAILNLSEEWSFEFGDFLTSTRKIEICDNTLCIGKLQILPSIKRPVILKNNYLDECCYPRHKVQIQIGKNEVMYFVNMAVASREEGDKIANFMMKYFAQQGNQNNQKSDIDKLNDTLMDIFHFLVGKESFDKNKDAL